ncbi:hypothetical protein [Flavobacterium sp.]|uniref:hypothetical protein n=1 Tax=Flavobacterium sp. TaxID=239 RepID=UPI0026325758|nr:hypothetical protein [Flavobacterium sp.]
MKKEFKKIQSLFPNLKTEEIEQKYLLEEELEVIHNILISGISGNPDLTLLIRDKEEAELIQKIPLQDLFLFKDYLGCLCEKKVEVILSEVGFRSYLLDRRLEENPIEIKINYKKQELKIKIQLADDENYLKFIVNHIRGANRYRFKRAIVLSIENISNLNVDNLENETKLILNSVLFDIEYNFNLSFESVSINSIQRRLRKKPKARHELPTEEINLTFKKYIPELIDYFHTAEKVDYTPFKFICYFHIIEYFQDKSAFFIVREKLKNIMLKPDFSMNVNLYVTQALNLVKQESEKHQTDKIKIQRVLRQFVEMEEIRQFLIDEELLTFFEKENVIDCSKPLILPSLDFSSDLRFIETLTGRIYSMRCSIVHSNPDFDDKKAVPFIGTINNMEKLRYEVELIMEIAKIIILKTTER